MKWDLVLDIFYKFFCNDINKQNIQELIFKFEKLQEEKNNHIFQFFKNEILITLRNKLNDQIVKNNCSNVSNIIFTYRILKII